MNMRGRKKTRMLGATAIALIVVARVAAGELTYVSEADVAARSFSVIAVSGEAVITATLEVFADPDGNLPVPAAVIANMSADVPGAHANGIIKITASNLDPETSYYFRLRVSSAGGDTSFPVVAPLYGVTTANTPATLAAGGSLRLNELVRFSPYIPAATATPRSVLVMLELPGVAATPVSTFVDANAVLASVYFDLNNLLDLNGSRLAVATDVGAQLRELRGLACGAASRVRFRKTPSSTAAGSELSFRNMPACFFADTVCDDVVNVLDFQFLLNSFGSAAGDCQFNPDLDIVLDDGIDVLDMQAILNRFGEIAPFD